MCAVLRRHEEYIYTVERSSGYIKKGKMKHKMYGQPLLVEERAMSIPCKHLLIIEKNKILYNLNLGGYGQDRRN